MYPVKRWFFAVLFISLFITLFIVFVTALFATTRSVVAADDGKLQEQLLREQLQREQLLTGIDAVYSMKFRDALAAFEKAIAQQPTEPRGYFHRASVFLWRYMFDYSETDGRRFWAASEQTLEVAEAALKANPSNPHPTVIIGAMYAFRAMANFRAENFVKGTLDMRTCYNYLSAVLKRDPAQYDAYLGMGMFHFVMGALPKPVRLMANLAGLKGDCALGLRELETAAQKSLYATNDAKMCLAMLNVYFNKDYDVGLRYLNDVLGRYPQNVLMLYTAGNVQFFLKKMPLAIERYTTVVRLADTNFKAITTLAQYRLGEAHFRLNDFRTAKLHFQRYFKNPAERSFRASSLLRLGMIIEMEGNRPEAIKGYRKVLELGVQTEPEDRAAVRKAKEFLQQPLDAIHIQLIKGVNCVESLRFPEADALLPSLAETTSLPADIRAEAAYFLAEKARYEKRMETAIQFYQKALAAAPVREKWIAPFSYFRLAETYRASGNERLAQAFVQKTRAFSGYDFEEQILFALERDVSMLK